MRKSIKKLVVGTMATVISVMPVCATTVDASTIIARVEARYSGFSVDVTKGNSSISFDIEDANTIVPGIDEYDLTSLAGTRERIEGLQNWEFEITNLGTDTYEVVSIILKDDQNNEIASVPGGLLSGYGDKTLSRTITTELLAYDLNYDGSVTLEDAQLANQLALGIKTASGLQEVMGDTNDNKVIDQEDAQEILQIALGIV